MYDEWLTDRSREAIELSKFSFVRTQCEERPQAIEIYSLNVPRAVGEGLAQHAHCTTKLYHCIIIVSCTCTCKLS